MPEKTLGLDLGTASIGWALVEDEGNNEGNVKGMGVRSFEEPIEPKSKEPKNAARRTARGLRKNTARRSQRRQALRSLLVPRQMIPDEAADEEAWLKATDPYELRARAILEPLNPLEFGRVLLHLVQRRGFLSNRKAKGLVRTGDPEVDRLIELDEEAEIERARGKTSREKGKDPEKEDEGVVLKAIAALRGELAEKGAATLGEFFARQLQFKLKVRGRHTLRAMFEEEFEKIWEVQARARPEFYTDSFRAAVYRAIYHQRPLKPQTNLQANCRLEPGKKAAHRDHFLSHQLRILQTLSDIELTVPGTWERRKLTLEERQKAYSTLQKSQELTWSAFRKLLKLPDKKKLLISHEGRAKLDKLPGNHTEAVLHSVTGGDWENWQEDKKELLMEILFSLDRDDVRLRRMRKELDLSAEAAYRLAISDFKRKPGAYSVKALKKLIPHMLEGLDLTRARTAAGYTQEWEKPKGEEGVLRFEDIPDVRNPGVSKIVHETRKVVNAIIRKYGKPDIIRVELGRDVAQSDEERLAIAKGQKRDEARNKEAQEKYASFYPGRIASRWDRKKYRLWVECRGVCPYTGRTIDLEHLWTKAWEIEHIIPYSLSLDDSMGNLTLCASEVNAAKGQRMPIEYFGEGTPEWGQAQSRVGEWLCGGHKKRKFAWTRESITEEFVDRQLNDTTYASRLILAYLETLGVKVEATAGKHTAILRRHWGLHTLLKEIQGRLPSPDAAPIPEEEAEKGQETKEGQPKARDDHRHHAIDALVVALTTKKLVKKIADLAQKGGGLEHSDWHAPLPWTRLRPQALEKVKEIIVSHEPTRRIRGPLHEETGYGYKEGRGFTTRKALAAMTPGEVERIVDKGLKRRMIEHLAANGGDPKKAFGTSDALEVVDRNGVVHQVKRARIHARGNDASVYMETKRGYFIGGSNHWCLIIERDAQPRDRSAEVVPLWQAVRAKRKGLGPESFVPEGWVLVAALCKNDMVEIVGPKAGIYRVRAFGAENPVDLRLVLHSSATESQEIRLRTAKALGMEFHKVLQVDMLGDHH